MIFGMELVLDLDNCDTDLIEDSLVLEAFAGDCVEHLGMKAYGDPIVEYFGHDDPVTEGFTLIQLIETSSIVGHFSPHLRRAHLNLFSCREFDAAKATTFCAEFFRGTVGQALSIIR